MTRLIDRLMIGAVALIVIVVVVVLFRVTGTGEDPAIASTRAELAAERDSTESWRVRAAAAESTAKRLRTDSSRVYPALGRLKASRDSARTASAALEQRLREVGDTAGAHVIAVADETAEAERHGCSLVVMNCEQRAANSETARADAAARVDSLAAQLDTLGVKWEDAEKRARPSFFRDLWRAKEAIGTLAVILAAVVVAK